MADNVTIPGAAFVSATDDITGVHFQRVKLIHGADGVNAGDVSTTNGLPVQGPLTDTQLRSTPVKVTSELNTVSFEGAAGTFRILGNAALLHNLFSIENAVGSAVNVRILSLTVRLDATAVLITVMPTIKTTRPTALPTGGTVLTKVALDTNKTSSASVILRGANAAEGGAATAITATQGPILKAEYSMRMHTLVGQIDGNPRALDTERPIILRAGQAILVCVESAPATSNPATNHWQVDVEWEEFT